MADHRAERDDDRAEEADACRTTPWPSSIDQLAGRSGTRVEQRLRAAARCRRCWRRRATASISRSACSLAPVISASCSSAKRHTVHAPTVSIALDAPTGRSLATGPSNARSSRSSTPIVDTSSGPVSASVARRPRPRSYREIGPFAHRRRSMRENRCGDKCIARTRALPQRVAPRARRAGKGRRAP